MFDNKFDIVVVGAGLIGTAAARYLQEWNPERRVLLIGPVEPQNRKNAEIFGAHYDEARITRVLDKDPIWACLAQRSIQRYRDLENRTGCHFYDEVGCLSLCQCPQLADETVASAKALKQAIVVLKNEDIQKKFSSLHSFDNFIGLYEPHNAGIINPRMLIEAQKTSFFLRGGYYVDDIVEEVKYTDEQKSTMMIRTKRNQHYVSQVVLLCCGAFFGFKNLLPNCGPLAIQLFTQQVLFWELDEQQVEQLKGVPAMVVRDNSFGDRGLAAYLLPPVRYPDGKFYLKIGHGSDFERELTSLADVQHWYRRGFDAQCERYLHSLLQRIFARLGAPRSCRSDFCVTAHSPNVKPYIGFAADRVALAAAGNGYAAKSSDEIGRLAALMVTQAFRSRQLVKDFRWTSDDPLLPADAFKIIFTNNSSKL